MKYYSTQRPVSPGTYPRQGVIEIVNFDYRKPIENISRPAWGYIEYDRELTPEEVMNYELTPEFHCAIAAPNSAYNKVYHLSI